MLKSVSGPLLAAALTAGMTALPVGDTFAQAPSPDRIIGVWESDDGDFKFEMFDAGETYAARVIYAKPLVEADGKTFKKDTLNPDPELRSRSLKGIVFLNDLKWDAGDRRWEGCSLYSGATGRTVSARVTLVGEKMELRGYMGTPTLGRTTVLHRAQ
ncbi:DUF2147 domain-containing protein [Neorhizobium galegae]|uniref:DUF2147 domain-containing protein n=1 Tax=Neorhizobium galegae TaxID=399 RepID=UPI002103D0A1|nr:DUF2147 domain-containing protein [Neorhizobium galegae]MCQ1836694.1 DUF2147 domain-containing protein [Neorhizobium galegae]